VYSINLSYNPFVPTEAGDWILVVEVNESNEVVEYTKLQVVDGNIGLSSTIG
jgi:hypothetical protein